MKTNSGIETDSSNESATRKLRSLKEILNNYGSLLVAFSGGVDSSFLLNVAKETLGDKTVAVTTHSAIYKDSELDFSKQFALSINVKHLIIDVNELGNEKFASNPYDRCYHCKSLLFDRLKTIAREQNLLYVADGTNYDDITDYRPGMTAATEFKVVSPLKDAMMTKDDIRMLSRDMGLRSWDKPSQPCLSTRFPYGTRLVEENLKLVEEAEEYLKSLGYINFRVRSEMDNARLEIDLAEMESKQTRASYNMIESRLKEIGFKKVELDPRGLRSGSMNHFLKNQS